MARAAVITDGVVTNVIEASKEYAEKKGFVLTDSAQMGDIYDQETGEFKTPEPEVPERTPQDLRDELNRIHNSYTANHTDHRGLMIAIDTEARVNASEVLASVKSGEQPLPFRWFSGDDYIEVNSVDDMQGIRDAIFSGLQRGFNAKGIVLDQIDATDDIQSFDVQAAWDAAMQ